MNYPKRITKESADELYKRLLTYLTTQKRYSSKNCLQNKAADALGVSIYTLSAAIKLSTGGSYSKMLNSLRLKDACNMLSDPEFANDNIEYIGLQCGFASRQAFYAAFARQHSITPAQYRELHLELPTP